MNKIKRELEIERIEQVEVLEALKEDWNSLLENNETKTVELSYEWQMTYWKNFNNNSKLFVLVVRDAESVVAIAPLRLTYIRKLGIRIRMLEFIAGRQSNYQDFIIRNNNSNVLEHILNYLISNRQLWDILKLIHLPEASTTANFFMNKIGDSFLCRIAEIQKCIFLKCDKTWEEHCKSLNKKMARQKISYRMRRLRRYGEINYFHCLNEEQFKSNLLKFFELHRKRWNQTRTPSHFNDEEHRKFYLKITQQLLPKKQIDLWVLRVGESPVAYIYSFLFHRNYLTQLITHDTAYSKGAPSLVLHEFFVKQAFANGIEEIDFGDYYPYKELWGNRLKNKVNLEIYPKRVLPNFIYIIKPLLDNIKHNISKR